MKKVVLKIHSFKASQLLFFHITNDFALVESEKVKSPNNPNETSKSLTDLSFLRLMERLKIKLCTHFSQDFGLQQKNYCV